MRFAQSRFRKTESILQGHRRCALIRRLTLRTFVAATVLCMPVGYATAQQLLGINTIAPQQDYNPAGMAEAFRTSATADGMVASITVYVDAASTATRLVAGLYTDAGGRPGTRLTQGTLDAPTAGQWNRVTVPAASVTAGTTYWLAILGPSGSGVLRFRDTPGGGRAITSAQKSLATLPATWTNGTTYSDAPLSAYASAALSAQPVLSVSPTAFSFAYTEGGTLPSASSLSVTNTGSGTLSFTATGNASWLAVSPASGTAPATESVGVSPSGLAVGSYSGQITIAASGATGSPVVIAVTLTVTAPPAPPPSTGDADWLMIGRDAARTGFAANDTMINKTNVANLSLLWTAATLDGKVSAQPLYVQALDVGGTPRDIVFTATAQNTLYALDANTGAQIWSRNFGANLGGCVSVPGGAGIRGTPAIDRSRGRIYVVPDDGVLYTVSLTDGSDVALPLPLVDLPTSNRVRGGLNLFSNNLYVATGSGGCDVPPWRGRIFRVDVGGTLPVLVSTFDVVPSLTGDHRGGGIWSYGGVSVDPATGNVYAATGADRNKLYTPYAVRMIALAPTLDLLGSYEPPHIIPWTCPSEPCDLDFGATPTVFQADGCPTMVAAGNKNGEFYVLRAADLAVSGTPLQALRLNIAFDPLDRGGVGGTPAFWPAGRMLFVTDSGPGVEGIAGGVIGLSIAPAPACTVSVAWSVPLPELQRAQSSATVAGDVVFVGEGGSGRVHAYDAATGTELWNSGGVIDGGTFGAPIVAGGKLFVGSWEGLGGSDRGLVRAFAPAGAPPPPSCEGTQPTMLFGTPTIGNIADDVPLGMAEAFQVTGAACGQLASVSLFVDTSSTAARVILGLYSDNGGHPGTLLATGSLIAPAPGQWNTIPVSATAITSGDSYWIAVLGAGSGTVRFRDQQGGCLSETSQESNLTVLPASWSTGTTYTTCPVSAYGNRAP